jgi:Fe-S-cluster-containing dehydrogenase component
MSMDRRSLLKGLAVAGAGAAVAGSEARAATSPPAPPEDAVGMLYDATRCIGCRACVTACKQANNLEYNLADPPTDLSGDTKNIIKLYEDPETDERSFMKAQCMHCLDPACASACMIGALQKREHGIVTWDGDRCIGCRYCQVACPFLIPKFQWDTPTPKIVKCEMCLHIIDTGGQPGCCQACPKQAVIFGPYTELLEEAHRRIAERPERYWGPDGTPKIYGEHDAGGTQVLYLAGVDFAKLGLPDLGEKPPALLGREIQHGVYKGFIAPAALYVLLGAAIWRGRRSGAGNGKEDE